MFVSKYGPVDLYTDPLEWEYNINICLEKYHTSVNGPDSTKTSGNSCEHRKKFWVLYKVGNLVFCWVII